MAKAKEKILNNLAIESLQPPYSLPADIIRSNQKDVYYSQELQDQISSVFSTLFGTRLQMKYQSELEMLCNVLYFGISTLKYPQTLGEEYCDIYQMSKTQLKFPSRLHRIIEISLYAIGPYILKKSVKRIHVKYNNSKLLSIINRYYSDISNTIRSSHLAIFYIFGSYYHISKRLTKLRYISPKQSNPDEELVGYEILGILIVIQLIIQAYLSRGKIMNGHSLPIESNDIPPEINDNIHPQQKCTLCLGPRVNSSVTPCGHVFCWKCILEWCETKPECPLCRQDIKISNIYPIFI